MTVKLKTCNEKNTRRCSWTLWGKICMVKIKRIIEKYAKQKKNKRKIRWPCKQYTHHHPAPLHTLVVKQPKCCLVSEAAPLISPGITPSNLVVSYLLVTNQPDQMNYPLCNCLDAQKISSNIQTHTYTCTYMKYKCTHQIFCLLHHAHAKGCSLSSTLTMVRKSSVYINKMLFLTDSNVEINQHFLNRSVQTTRREKAYQLCNFKHKHLENSN